MFGERCSRSMRSPRSSLLQSDWTSGDRIKMMCRGGERSVGKSGRADHGIRTLSEASRRHPWELRTFLILRIKDRKIQSKKNSTFVTPSPRSRLPKTIMPDTPPPPPSFPPNCALRFRTLSTTSPDCKGARLDSSAILVTEDTFVSFKENIASCSTFDELLTRTAADVSSASHVVGGDGHILIVQQTETEELLKKRREASSKCVGCSSVPVAALTGERLREAAEAVDAYRDAARAESNREYHLSSIAVEELRYIQLLPWRNYGISNCGIAVEELLPFTVTLQKSC